MAITAVYAGFKTAWNQREIRLDAKPSTNLYVGQLCTYTASTKALVAKTTATPAVGDYIIAQSDVTTSNSHVPVENHSYAYDDKVAASTTEKIVMVFKVVDAEDVYVTKTIEST